MKSSSFLLLLLFSQFISFAATPKPGFVEVRITSDLNLPTSMALVTDGRIFVTEKGGTIKIIENGIVLDEPFYQVEVDVFGERGIHGIALDPDFEKNGYIYLFYTVKDEDKNRLSRVTANGNLAIPGSEVTLLEVEGLISVTHNGGAIHFGKDGKLYMPIGDNLQRGKVQQLNSLFGKILRINPDGSIPTDNPYYNETTGINKAIYALGFRNPFSMDIHDETGVIFVNDVGESSWEEVNKITYGSNHGWPSIEGPITAGQDEHDNYSNPFFYYDHSEGCAIVGAAFYTPESSNFPEGYDDDFFFADFCQGHIMSLDTSTGIVDTIMYNTVNPTNIQVSNDGSLYYLSFFTGLWKIDYVGTGPPIISREPDSVLAVVGENISFETAAVGTGQITYTWYKNNQEIENSNSPILELQTISLADSGSIFYAVAQNSLGSTPTKEVILKVTTNERPELQITVNQTKYSGGDTLLFSGIATDKEDGLIHEGQIAWNVRFHHDLHTHPGLLILGEDSGSFIIPQLGELDTNVWYSITMEASDDNGKLSSKTINVYPNKNIFALTSNLGTVPLSLDGKKIESIAETVVSGLLRSVEAPQFYVRNDSLFKFSKWSNNETDLILQIGLPNSSLEIKAEYVYETFFVQGNGDGITGYYYSNDSLYGEPALVQKEEKIDFNYEWDSPDRDIVGFNNYSASWKGYLLAPITGEYTLYFDFNDGLRFLMNDQLLFDSWDQPNFDSIKVNLVAGQFYKIELQFIERLYLAYAMISWSHDYTNRQIVPTEFLYTDIISGKNESEDSPISFYPNPATNYINIAEYGNYDIEILNENGQRLVKETYLMSKRIELPDLQKGTYLIIISRNKKVTKAQKLIITD